MGYNNYLLLFFLGWSRSVSSDVSDIFRIDNVKVIENIVTDSYFSYSLLLQSGKDGATLFVGAPKDRMNMMNPDGNIYRCRWKQNSSSECAVFKIDIGVRDTESFYDYGYAMGGFDVSFYNQGGPKMLIGAPGVKKLSGTTATYSCDTTRLEMVMPEAYDLKYDIFESDGYFGYSVISLKLKEDDKRVFMAGAPRGHDLYGVVRLYEYDTSYKTKMYVFKTFYGFEIGAYFGASLLAADVTRDRLTDIFISAPMTKGSTWDEGAVYFYSNIKFARDLKPTAILTSKYSVNGGRFGTTMSSLGDYDLDGYNDIAIGAPYEDSGLGAVYIYRGTQKGVKLAQRITPSQFNLNKPSRGFGLGLSRGNDIDSNGHNDIAVGAYKSDQVFIIHSRQIIDFACQLTPGSSSLSSKMTDLGLTLCIAVTRRSERSSLTEVPFSIYMDSMDYRLVPELKSDVIRVPFNNPICKMYTLRVKDMFSNIQPLEVNVTVAVELNDVIAYGAKHLLLEIPYQHGCGGDNKCETGLSIDMDTDRTRFIIGKDSEIIVKVIVANKADTAYNCEVYFEVPDGVQLRSSKFCAKSESTYICKVTDRLQSGSIEDIYTFEVTNLNISLNHIKISSSVKAFGKNQPGYKDNDTLSIPVKLETKPFLDSQSPENLQLSTIYSKETEVVVTHNFTVGNGGPSPLLFDLLISVPVVTYKDQSVFEIMEVMGLIRSEFPCVRTGDTTRPAKRDVSKLANISLNKTIVLSCEGGNDCVHYVCENILIDSSRDVATFWVKIALKPDILVKALIGELYQNSFVAYTPSAEMQYSDGSLNATSVWFIIAQVTYIPLWVYLVAGLVAAILLMVIIFVLYKCHFFDRNLKDKIMQQKILDDDDAINNEIYNEEVFNPMKSYDQAKT
ncbi:integrin alpha-5-like isoform X3 [Rhynchophorus ferrugineus]|uniref:integrin alpha-5-like isoform X3 n=1 Tax=Rhynchophorus ferrugineus TaxID=354439 RepID=UPI003FCEE058